jgi:hypothetical protein
MPIIRRMNCIDAVSGVVILSQWPFRADAASIQFILLMMGMGIMLETCRGL